MSIQNTFAQSWANTRAFISNFLNKENTTESLVTAFGENFAIDLGISLLKAIAVDNSDISIKIVPQANINNARGAYSASNNTIYLSTDLLADGNVNAVSKTLLEEIGHYLDDKANTSDASGDEGAIFASLVSGEELNNRQFNLLQAEDDRAIVELEGETQLIEQDGIIYVDLDSTGNNDGSSWSNAYINLQDALAVATEGDEIWVAEGTYFPTTDSDRSISFVIPSDVSVYGGFAGSETELNARNIEENITVLSGEIGDTERIDDNTFQVVRITDASNNTTLDGFTITKGYANGSRNSSGGGIFASNSAAVLTNLIISENTAPFGGGIYSGNSQHQLSNIQFLNNLAFDALNGSGFGGGGFRTNRSNDTLTDVVFRDNLSEINGGGIYNDGSTLNLDNVEFISNEANDRGGGIYNDGGEFAFASERINVNLDNIVVRSNRASVAGGAIYNRTSNVTAANLIVANNASENGAGIYSDRSSLDLEGAVFNSNLAAVSGGAIHNDFTDAKGVNLTLTNNEAETGTAVYNSGQNNTAEFYNSIFWGNRGSNPAPIVSEGVETTVGNSIVENGFPGGQNIFDADPQFVDLEEGDLRIRSGSPAVNTGFNDVVTLDTDIAGQPRIFNDVVDIGAYEYSEPYITVDEPSTIVRVSSEEPIEDREVTFTLRLADSADESVTRDSAISVNYVTVDGSAVVGEDYVSTSGTITFEPEETEKTIAVPIFSNTEDEQDESFFIELSDASSEVIGFDERGAATIYSVSNSVTISIADVSIAESNEDTILNFTVFLNEAAEEAVTVDYAVTDDTAVAEEDYIPASGTLTFEPGETEQNIAVTVVGDANFEEDERFFVNLTNPSVNGELGDSQATGTIINDEEEPVQDEPDEDEPDEDEPPVLSVISIADASAVEADEEDSTLSSVLNFTVSLNEAAEETVTVSYEIESDTAVAGEDYIDTSGTVTFEPGETEQSVGVTVLGDTLPEGDESFLVNLSNPSVNAELGDSQATGTIVDNETQIMTGISVEDAIAEVSDDGNILNFRVFLSKITEEAVTVNYKLEDNTATVGEDYIDTSGSVTFEPGETEQNIEITAIENDREEDESFYLNLSEPSSNAELIDARGIGNITATNNEDDGGEDDDNEDDTLSTIELFRFRNTTFDTGTYIFVGAEERDAILENSTLSQTFELEGDGNSAFIASNEAREDLIPFYRLRSQDVPGTYIFVSTPEYDTIFAENSEQKDKWLKEGLDEAGEEDIPEFYLLDGAIDRGVQFNRFQNNQNGTFLYAGQEETEAIESDSNLTNLFANQGIAFKSIN